MKRPPTDVKLNSLINRMKKQANSGYFGLAAETIVMDLLPYIYERFMNQAKKRNDDGKGKVD